MLTILAHTIETEVSILFRKIKLSIVLDWQREFQEIGHLASSVLLATTQKTIAKKGLTYTIMKLFSAATLFVFASAISLATAAKKPELVRGCSC